MEGICIFKKKSIFVPVLREGKRILSGRFFRDIYSKCPGAKTAEPKANYYLRYLGTSYKALRFAEV